MTPGSAERSRAWLGWRQGFAQFANTSADAALNYRLGKPRRFQLVLGCLLLLPVVLAAGYPTLMLPFDPLANVGPQLAQPSARHPFGTDDLGRDLFSAVVAGARSSLLVGGGTAAISITVGLLIGIVAGYFGGLVDDGLMRLTEMLMVLPRFFIALLVVALFGASLAHVCLVLGLTGWPGLARIVRLDTLSYRERGHVAAAITLGASHLTIVRDHILPFVRQPILSVAAPIVTSAILTEAGLSYLGLADPNWISWGKLIQNGQTFVNHGWWLAIFPGIALVLTCVGVAFVLGAADRD